MFGTASIIQPAPGGSASADTSLLLEPFALTGSGAQTGDIVGVDLQPENAGTNGATNVYGARSKVTTVLGPITNAYNFYSYAPTILSGGSIASFIRALPGKHDGGDKQLRDLLGRRQKLLRRNVGIGTASPATKLHMSSGTLTVDGNTGGINVTAPNGITSTYGITGGSLTVTGSTVSVNGATTFWPSANASGALTNNGSGVLTWAPAASGGSAVAGGCH